MRYTSTARRTGSTAPRRANMRVALYSRVSSEDQVQKYGLPSQLSALRHLAATNGYEVVAEVADEGISGTVEARPGLERLRHLLLQHAINGVLIYDLSRLARDTLLCLRLLKELQEDLGAHVEFVNMKLDDTPESALFTGMSSLMFQFERQKLMQRTAGGRRVKAERGIVPGAPWPFGYEGDTTVPGGLRVIEAEAEVVQMLYAWAADGVSLREMVRRLAGRGVRTRRGGIFNKASVAK